MKKFSKKFLFYHLLIDIFTSFVAVIAFTGFLFPDEDETAPDNGISLFIIAVIVFVISYAVLIAYRAIFLNVSGYQLGDNEVKCRKGVLFRKESVLEYNKIHAINKHANLIHKLFGIAVLTLDSGSTNTAYSAEITVYEKESVVDEIMRVINAKQSGKELEEYTEQSIAPAFLQEHNGYAFTSKRKLIFSAINLFNAVLGTLVFAIVAGIVFSVLIPYINLPADEEGISLVIVALAIAVCGVVGLGFLSFVGSIIASFVGYYDFKVFKTQDNLQISYGLIQKSCNTFKLDRIKAVKITQSVIQRIFGFATVNIEVIGYGVKDKSSDNDKNCVGILFPLCKFSELSDKIKDVLPNYVPQQRETQAKRYFPFVSWKYVGFTAVFAALAGIASLVSEAAVAVVLTVAVIGAVWIAVRGVFRFKTQGIAVSDEKVTVYHGAFSRGITVIRQSNIIGVEEVTTPMRKKKGIYSIKIHVYTNAMTNVVTVYNLDLESVNKLRKALID